MGPRAFQFANDQQSHQHVYQREQQENYQQLISKPPTVLLDQLNKRALLENQAMQSMALRYDIDGTTSTTEQAGFEGLHPSHAC